MARKISSDLFPWAIGLSLLGHLLLPWIPTGDVVDLPEYEIEERVAAEPMTVRLITPEPVPTPVPIERQDEPLMTSERGRRVVDDIAPLPTPLERASQDVPPPPFESPLAPELDEPEPAPIIPEVPIQPEAPLEPPPEPIELPVAEPTPAKPAEVPLPIGPVEQESQSGVTSRAEPIGKGNRAPRYPRRARAAKMEGTTELEVTVRSDGTVERLVVKRSSGHSLLDDEALKAVKRWRFSPASGRSGTRVEDTVIVPVTFRLSGPKRR